MKRRKRKQKSLAQNLNKEMERQLVVYENIIGIMMIYLQCVDKTTFHHILTKPEKIEMSKLGRAIGRKELRKYDLPHKTRTILDWLPELTKTGRYKCARKITKATINFVLRVINENYDMGHRAIFAICRNLGIVISPSTIIRIMRDYAVPPYKRRVWKYSERIVSTIKWHSCDFVKEKIITPYGKITVSILFFINNKTRKIHIAGFTENPNAHWTKQQFKNATMADWGFLKPGDRLIHDGDGCFIADEMKDMLEACGIESVKTPPYSPNCNAIAERFVKTLRKECLNRLIFFSEDRLRMALKEFEIYYNGFRNHQGVGNILLDEDECERISNISEGKIKKRTFLGGLNYYYRDVA